MAQFSDYLSLTKPRIGLMILVTTSIGYFMADTTFSPLVFFCTLTASLLTCAGSAVLNNFLERESDKQMERTKNRPLPSGLISAESALTMGVLLVLGGTGLMVWQVNILAAFLALLTAFLYVLVYTPLKRVTWLNTTIGAIPGALPPMGGWAAASGHLELGAWILFALLFVWQHPHFFAIAWIYKDDYQRGGMKMLPAIDPGGTRTSRQVLVYSLLLVPVVVLPVQIGLLGGVYYVGALFLTSLMLAGGVWFALTRSLSSARRLLHCSLVYFPGLLALVMLDIVA